MLKRYHPIGFLSLAKRHASQPVGTKSKGYTCMSHLWLKFCSAILAKLKAQWKLNT